MDTYFAPAERCSDEELREQVEIVSRNPVIDGLLKFTSGLLAILDEHRQILAVNASLLEMLGIEDTSAVLGLRPGEAIYCVHADEGPGGCGTAIACSSCGAAIAIVTTLANDTPTERTCAATVKREGQEIDVCFQVRCVPIKFDGRRFLLLFLQDITSQQKWVSLERVFFHDIMNILNGVIGTTELMTLDGCDQDLVEILGELAVQLKNEIAIQRVLSDTKHQGYELARQRVTTGQVVKGIRNVFANHPVAESKSFTIIVPFPDLSVNTDYSLLLKVLVNMLTNAFEATDTNGEVRFRIDRGEKTVSFSVWNKLPIPENVRPRIFQRHFTTKTGAGRGIGTFSMKLCGEDLLGGKVSFTTSEDEGTTFSLTLPSTEPEDSMPSEQ
ncbi:MAG: HAMP domain-containing histidine kinase [Desulfomonile tiedjei]|nr:HAMP domain-containing histidine kinase [Desulfomonile tiedjei]